MKQHDAAKNSQDKRARDAASGIKEVRSIMAPICLHDEIKKRARAFIKDNDKE